MNWQNFLDEIAKWECVRIDPKSFVSIKYATPVTPAQYLEFADRDLLQANDHGYVNALSNSKRAIDCQITNLLIGLGLSKLGNIHNKIERIKDIGILAPRILKKLNKIRNLLEHEFHSPSAEEAEDAVDIATLFLGATEKVFINFMDSFWVARDGSENHAEIYREGNRTIIIDDAVPKNTFADGIYIEYDLERCDYGVCCYLENREVFEAEVKKGSPLHIELIKYSTLNHSNAYEYDENLAGNEFLSKVISKAGIIP